MQEKWQDHINERGAVKYCRTSLVGEDKVGIQFIEGWLLFEQELVKNHQAVRFRNHSSVKKEERQAVYLRLGK